MPVLDSLSPPAIPDSDAPLRVLIVDDQAVVRGALRGALEKAERAIEVIEVDSGEEALAVMVRGRIDVVFCDVYLPGMTGPEALAQAYAGRWPRPFLILMSSARNPAIAEIGRQVGVYEFLGKPFRAQSVLAALHAYDRLRRPVRLLVVDDSATARKLMGKILAQSQFHLAVSEAASGKEALALAAKAPPDVVFLDLNMPELDGVETAGRLIQMRPGLQVAIVSTEQQMAKVRSAQFAGAFAYLRKPFDVFDVDALLHSAFSLTPPSIQPPTHAIFSRDAAEAGARSVPG